MTTPDELREVRLRLATTASIRRQSAGDLAALDGPPDDVLFSPTVYGAPDEVTCVCGRLSAEEAPGARCPKCGYEPARGLAYRLRMAHIELAAPVLHPWVLRVPPYPAAALLGVGRNDLVAVAHGERGLVRPDGRAWTTDAATADNSGVAAIRAALGQVDLGSLGASLRGQPGDEEARQALQVLRALRHSGLAPTDLVLEAIPVLPPALRPAQRAAEGEMAAADAHALYVTVLERNARLRAATADGLPAALQRDLARSLQLAVEALLDAAAPEGQRSLATLIKGKEGLFRRHILGKRQDYSGRSVVTPAPDLQIHEVGVPGRLLLELFKPFVMHELLRTRKAASISAARRMVERGHVRALEAAARVTPGHAVLLNRAPTLHRLGIQAFYPRLVQGDALAIHPLTCVAFNADFDGDQMAIMVPLTAEACREAETLLLSSHNLFSPSTGEPLANPVQEMVLGCAYLTRDPDAGPAVVFGSTLGVRRALAAGEVGAATPVQVPVDGQPVATTAGRVALSAALPEGLGFVNEALDKQRLSALVRECRERLGNAAAAELVGRLQDLGFEWATRWGASVSWADLDPLPERDELLAAALAETQSLPAPEAWERWEGALASTREATMAHLAAQADGLNPVYVMVSSQARARPRHVQAATVMHGLHGADDGRGWSVVTGCYRLGLDPNEYAVVSRTARQGLAGVMVRSADSGYAGRRLVAATGDLVVIEADCGTQHGLEVRVDDPSSLGRRLAEPAGDLPAGHETTAEDLAALQAAGVAQVVVRSPVTCETEGGLCGCCYGRLPDSGEPADLGAPVGLNAALSVMEPSMQLTFRAFASFPVSLDEPRAEFTPRGLSRLIALLEAATLPDPTQAGRWVPTDEVLQHLGVTGTTHLLIEELAGLFAEQGIAINARHFEVIVRQMLSRVRVTAAGDTELIPGEVVTRSAFAAAAASATEPPEAEPVVVGVDEIGQSPDSFLAAAGFQRTAEVLLNAALHGDVDHLRGMRESLTVGKLVPAGTGFAARHGEGAWPDVPAPVGRVCSTCSP